jgi:Family of unknown function (DUF6368)
MAGGTTTILLKSFSPANLFQLEHFISDRSEVQESRPHYWDIQAFSNPPTGRKKFRQTPRLKEKRPFVIQFFERQAEFDEDPDNQTLIKKLGFSNTCSIDVAAMCSEPVDQRLQAEITAELAEMFEGLIYLNGLLSPNAVPNCTLAAAQEFASGIRGTIHFAEYVLDNGERWANQIVDAIYLRNWLQHPDFRMPK